MSTAHRFSDNPINWAMTIGRFFGIRVQVHLFFILWAAVELLIRLDHVAWWLVFTVCLFLVVLVHEFGHCFGARFMGGTAEHILMWPLGGLAFVDAPLTPRAQFVTAAAGPLVNVIFCVFAGAVLLLTGGPDGLSLDPLHPIVISSVPVQSWTVTQWISLFWSVNYLILLFNLLPVFPMDGGRLLQAVLWRYKGRHAATMIATTVGMVGAIVFGAVGLVTQNLILAGVAIFGYLTCWQQRQMMREELFDTSDAWGYDFSRGYHAFTSEEATRPSWWSRRRAARLARKADDEREARRRREAEIDAVLDKVHRLGVQSLTLREKRLLKSETERKKGA